MRLTDPTTISALSSAVMAAIWLVYLHIIFTRYRADNRPFLIIQHAHENDPAALCLLVNLSREPVHIQCVIANIYGDFGHVRHYITDYTRIDPDDHNIQARLRLGPLHPGGYLILGSFEQILLGERSETETPEPTAAGPGQHRLRQIDSFEIDVAVVYGPRQYHIGARRHFSLLHEDHTSRVHAMSIHTEQLISRRKREIVRRWVEERIEPRERGDDQDQHTNQSHARK